MSKSFNRLAALSVDQRWFVILLVSIITVVAVIGYRDPHLLLQLFETADEQEDAATAATPDDDRPQRQVPNVSPFSLSGGDVVVVVQGDNFFNANCATALRQVVEDLEDLDQVASVLWLDRVPTLNIFGLPEPLFPRSTASANRFAAAKEKALQHPLVGGQLLSGDGKTLLLLLGLNYDHVLDDAEATTLLRETAEATAARFPDVDLKFQSTGRVPAALAAIEAHEANQLKYQLIGYGMIFVMTLILFRGIRAVMIVAAAPALGVFWTIGMVQYLGYEHNPLIDVILPVLVSLVGLTDGVHLMVQIRKLRAGGLPEKVAARLGIQQVGMACFLTSLTTAIGFGSLTQAESEMVNEFGMCCVFGVTLTFVSVVTIIPFACSTWLGRKIHVGLDSSLIDRNLGRISGVVDAVLQRRSLVSKLAIAATLMFFAISLTLKPDQRQSDGLPEKAEATIALHHLDKAFGGLEFSRVEVRWTDDVPSDSAELLIVISAVDDLLRAEELIGHPLSIRNLIDAQPGSGPPEERMSLMELLPPPLKRAFFTPERNEAKVTFRVQDLGIAAYGPVFERIEAGCAAIRKEHPDFRFELRGNAVWRWQHLYQVVVDLAASLGTASVVIFFVLAIVYRSIRIGLISIIPNMFPLVLTGAYLAMTGYNLEIVMVCNFTVCLGIAVDDTIHFLTRYQEENAKTDDQDEAIRKAFTGVGTALIMTTTVLIAGFGTVILSESRDHKIFATMGVLTIGSALFGDLVFLPALLGRFAAKKDRTSDQE
ncbi:MAG: efflux RND transporter permease subunit [Fuerstiella sp.]|nr:efflux RND transporter permease subunit [Fuerstiella sp.]